MPSSGVIAGTDPDGNTIRVAVTPQGKLRVAGDRDENRDLLMGILNQLQAIRIGMELAGDMHIGDLLDLAQSEV